MNQPLSWIWVAQVMVLIAAGTAGLLAIMWVTLRGRPTWHHVVTHEVNRGWEEIRAEIEARERDKGLKPQWVYHGTHDRQNGAHAREAEAPGGSSLHDHRPHRDGRQPPAPAWPVGAGAGRLVQAPGGSTRVRSRPGMGRRSPPGCRSNWGGGGILSSHSLLHASRAIAPPSCPKRSTRTGPPRCWTPRVTASNTT
jgi:hypothetical protein